MLHSRRRAPTSALVISAMKLFSSIAERTGAKTAKYNKGSMRFWRCGQGHFVGQNFLKAKTHNRDDTGIRDRARHEVTIAEIGCCCYNKWQNVMEWPASCGLFSSSCGPRPRAWRSPRPDVAQTLSVTLCASPACACNPFMLEHAYIYAIQSIHASMRTHTHAMETA